jgi:endonuclease-3 related protein
MNPKKIYKLLLNNYGPQGWWPIFVMSKIRTNKMRIENNLAYNIKWTNLKNHKTSFRDPYFEIALGAILTQSTSWKSVAIAINNLYQLKALTPKKYLALPSDKLLSAIRPAGYFQQKAKKTKIFAEWLIKNYEGNILNLKSKKLTTIREELLSQWGIGPETADSIILYALNKPIFVIDEYTRRLCKIIGIEFKIYDEYRNYFEKGLDKEKNKIKMWQEYHALIVASGKEKHPLF